MIGRTITTKTLLDTIENTIKWGIVAITAKHGFNVSEYPSMKEILIGIFYSTIGILIWELSIGRSIKHYRNASSTTDHTQATD